MNKQAILWSGMKNMKSKFSRQNTTKRMIGVSFVQEQKTVFKPQGANVEQIALFGGEKK